MTKTGLLLAAMCLTGNLAFGHEGHGNDKIGGIPLADFGVNELRIPCVEVKNLDPKVDGHFFDVILDRRGNSMNFELKFAQVEDPNLCQAIADFAKFLDDDFDDDGAANIQVICKRRENRSKVSVNAKNLSAGRYAAEIASGMNTAASPLKNTIGDEVEFDFDSDLGEIAEGATAIPPGFIQGAVSAKVLSEAGKTVAAVNSVSCLNK